MLEFGLCALEWAEAHYSLQFGHTWTSLTDSPTYTQCPLTDWGERKGKMGEKKMEMDATEYEAGASF